MLENVMNYIDRLLYEAKEYSETEEEVMENYRAATEIMMFALTYLGINYDDISDFWNKMGKEFRKVADEK